MTTLARQPAGIPTGGQFAATDRAESAVTLSGDNAARDAAIQAARNLCSDTDNPDWDTNDYLRGQVELLADMFGNPFGDERDSEEVRDWYAAEITRANGDDTLAGHDPAVDTFLTLNAEARVAAAKEARLLEEAERRAVEARAAAAEYLHAAPSSEPIGYTYKAENFRADHIVERLIADQLLSPAARDMSVTDAIHQAASANAINMLDQYSYDSDDFPKPIDVGQVDLDVDADWLADDIQTWAE